MNDQELPLQPATPALSPGDQTTGGDPHPERVSALYCRGSHLRLWVTTILGLAADLWTKHWAFNAMDGRCTILDGVLSFQRNLNRGALFGMGQGLKWVFVIASMFAIVFVLYVFSRSFRLQRSFHIALGLVLAGALGNLYDRLFNNGMVRDFIKIEFSIGTFALWPWIFNVADVLLVVGVSLLLLNIWNDRSRPRTSDA